MERVDLVVAEPAGSLGPDEEPALRGRRSPLPDLARVLVTTSTGPVPLATITVTPTIRLYQRAVGAINGLLAQL
jgi:hypothetical protein